MAVTPLKDWPNELLSSLLNLLPLTDLLSMTKVSKSIYALSLPLVYSTIETTWALGRTPSIVLLLRSLVERPELSGYIRNLRLEGNGVQGRPELRELPAFPLDAPLLSKASKIIQSTKVPFADLWIHELQSGTVDAIVALLLATLSNLTSLFLGPNFTVRSRLCGGMLRCALCKPQKNLPAYKNLRHVTSKFRAKEYFHTDICNAADILPLFYLPSIEDLSVSIDNPAEFTWPASYAPAPSIVSLDIYRLRESRLGPVLSVLKALQKLHWHWSYQPDLDEEVSKGVVRLDTAAAALNEVADTLTDLTISAMTRPRYSVGDYDPPPLEIRASLDGLSRLRKLTKLSLPWAFLMGFSKSPTKRLLSALPPSLEVLRLTADLDDHDEWEWEEEDSVIDAIKLELASLNSSRHPSLRRIILPIPFEYNEMTEDQKEELQTIGARVGLELGWFNRLK
ncbi:F-box domain, cyclin-like protein [Beauveria brongniartii RCEF 3172]|uniref:F-box domain, cyclin-like protein n=1 Tax=Beauveria brongniartii RCEF 3172 TaxID=1081107 RepID=A0A167CFL8_9HYPO|nr:F-box domain, cyclin-like protein [Beauveria brongniartii RCEF 3172]